MDIRAPDQRYNPYRIFSREQWAALRNDTPMTLEPGEFSQLRSLHEAATASFQGLANSAGAGGQEKLSGEALETLSLDQAAVIAGAWSLVHGFTMLLLDGRLKDILHRLPAGTGTDQLLDAMLRSTVRRPPGA
jgi:hypothetical protein